MFCFVLIPTWLFERSRRTIEGFLFNERGMDGEAPRGLINRRTMYEFIMNRARGIVDIGKVGNIVSPCTVDHGNGSLV